MKARWKNRDGHDAGVQATPKCGDEFEPTRVEKQGAFSRRGRRRECSRNGAGARFQLFVSEARLFGLAVGQIAESEARAVLRCSCAEQLNQIREARVTIG